MSEFSRYAIYYLPGGPLAGFGAAWLGWDVLSGQAVPPPEVPGLDSEEIRAITATPRKYGLHATLKPPFRLAEGLDEADLQAEVEALAARLTPATAGRLHLTRIAGFLALVPEGETAGLGDLAGACVEALDRFRAPPTKAETARHKAADLTERQQALLGRWGYPYVFEEFRLHLTLTGRLGDHAADRVEAALSPSLPPLPEPFALDRISLVGETPEGFRLIRHAPLTG